MAFGTVLAAFPGRRRRPTSPVSAPVPLAGDRRRAGDDRADDDEAASQSDAGAGSCLRAAGGSRRSSRSPSRVVDRRAVRRARRQRPRRANETADSFLLDKPAPRVVSTVLSDAEPSRRRRRSTSVAARAAGSSSTSSIPTACRASTSTRELVAFDAAAGRARRRGRRAVHDHQQGQPTPRSREFFAENGGDWPVVRDPNGAISVAFGVSQVPETWIIDPDGIVRER